MPEAYIFDAVRTPRGRGRADGALHEITPVSLAAQVLGAVRERNGLDSAVLEDVAFGCVSPVGEQGAVITRTAVLQAGFAESTGGLQVNRFCGSGLDACNIVAAKVIAGECDLAIGGGVESMSRVPMGSDGGAWPTDPASAFRNYFIPQGVAADLVATEYGFSREDVDAYAVESHVRAARAWAEGRFGGAIVPVRDVLGLEVLDHDETIRPDATLQSMGALPAAFAGLGDKGGFDQVALQRYPGLEKIRHVHHAGNSSGIVDGAAAVLIGSEAAGRGKGLRPRARIRAMASVGSDPTIMLTGPEAAAAKALKRAGMQPGDVELYELNEAFASVVLRFMQALDVDHDAINVNGGAIAMGHPLGATGAMILGTLVDELERSGKGIGLVTLCIAAGMATATIIERV